MGDTHLDVDYPPSYANSLFGTICQEYTNFVHVSAKWRSLLCGWFLGGVVLCRVSAFPLFVSSMYLLACIYLCLWEDVQPSKMASTCKGCKLGHIQVLP